MKKLSSYQIKKMWIDFFISKNHHLVEAVPLVPRDDPTLLWINSGVAGLKKYFDGSEVPPFKRLVNYQRAIRTNDIENVGVTSRHHTFFEMLGNFSIGDYFRKEAIEYAFELLTSSEWYGLDKNLLYFTYHPNDLETKNYWLSLGVAESHLIPLAGNYWEIGEGPCGPNTEVFYDRGLKYDPENIGIKLLKEDIDNDRYIEIWGIVFSQYNAKAGVKREDYQELPQKNIDTGLGFERLVSIIQEGDTNYDTDLFLPIIKEIEKHTAIKYIDNKMAYRIIADHLRATVFALSDGAVFSNDGRGYVLRRLIRRAIRYIKKLNIQGLFFYLLIPTLVKEMSNAYPYLEEKEELVTKLIKIEEEKFEQTLNKGEALFNLVIASSTTKVINGEDAFKLYDTYGFPLELTMEMASENGFSVDIVGYQEAMKVQQNKARASRGEEASMTAQSKVLLDFTKKSSFSYDKIKIITKPLLLIKDGQEVNEITATGEVIFNETVFYGESGGQVGDTGLIYGDGFKALVKDTKKAPNGQHLHFLEVLNGKLDLNSQVTLELDYLRRNKIKRNHSTAHLLQYALKEVLGNHIEQAGSYVDESKLRFDFTHYQKISKEELTRIEILVNNLIAKELKSIISEMNIEDAKKLGATMLFTEKYGSTVRVVNFGNISMELCGGCHVDSTSDIGIFVIDFESSISSGVRRIEAQVSQAGYHLLSSRIKLLESAANYLNASSIYEVVDKTKSTIEHNVLLEKKVAQLELLLAGSKIDKFITSAAIKDEVHYIIELLDSEKKITLKIGEELKGRLKDYLIVLASTYEGITSVFVFASNKVISAGIDANSLVKELAKFNIRGGGKKEFAQGGGNASPELNKYLQELKERFK